MLTFCISLNLLLAPLVLGVPYTHGSLDELYSNDEYMDGYDQNGNSDIEESVITRTPTFVSESKSALVNEGGTIRLPCIVNRLEGFVLLWKKGQDIITVGNQIVYKTDTRVRLEEETNGNYLVVSLAQESDAGEYICQISAYKPTEIKHTVNIRVQPSLSVVPSSGVLAVKEGESATLQCDITAGSPTPEIKWSRRERMMPSGEEEISGNMITFSQVTRHHSGHYICSADNGFGPQPVTAQIKLDVQHMPTIEQEQTLIHTSSGDQEEVVCIVHSSPHATVTWLKNGQPIDTATNVISQRGNKHSLTLVDINEDMFGQYTCRATNKLGTVEKTTQISGKAMEAVIKSDAQGSQNNRYKLEWITVSKSPITTFKVQYKANDDFVRKEVEVSATPVESDYWSGSHELTNLRPATVYTVRVASRNTFGYNDFGEEFQFATKGAEPMYSAVSSSPSWIKSSAVVLASTLTVLLLRA